jgi:hypothetical protein
MQRWIHGIRLSHRLTKLELAGLAAYRPPEDMLAPLADMQPWAAAQAAGDPAAKDTLLQARSLAERQMAGRVSTAVGYGGAAGEDARRWTRRSSNWGPLTATRAPVPVNEAAPDTAGGSGDRSEF